jgi:hypothetical protein
MRHLLTATIAVAAAFSSAHAAALTIAQSANFSPISSLTWDVTEGSSPVTSAIDRALSFSRFNAGTGVLTGISSTLDLNGGSAYLVALGTKEKGGTPAFSSQAMISAGSSLPGLSAFGAINETLANSCSGSNGCFPQGISNLLYNSQMLKTDTTWLDKTVSVAQGSLNSYVGTGAIASTLTATTSVSLQNENKIDGGLAKLLVTGLKGNQSLTYSYLTHANASFTAGSDTNVLGPLGASSFSVFNLGGSSTAKLDFVSLQCVSGHCDAFDVTLPSFQDLAAGASVAGSAGLATSAAGDYAATYKLVFSDDTAVGATSTHLQNSLTLNLQGSVPAVPEPGSWALLSLGLLGLAVRRRKQ